jgi:DNA ligase-associated metallophosphoesterase
MNAFGAAEIDLQGEHLLLLPERAIYWPARRTLIIADPHFGKDDIFRRAGIALPRGPAIADLQRLTRLIEQHSVERLLILGDFVHGATREGDSFLHAFALWRKSHSPVAVVVIAGNHDRREARSKWEGLVDWCTEPCVDPPFVFVHEPEEMDSGYAVSGHIHPVVRLPAPSSTVRVPVFWVRPRYLVLPSYGSFTGGARVNPESGDRLYAAAPERVIPLAR